MNWKLLIQLTVSLFFVPVATIVVFYYGWSNKPHSWFIIWAGTLAALPVAFIHALLEALWMKTKVQKFLVRLLTHTLIFVLSCVVIIYGWGMEPQRWWVIIGGYLLAMFLPPFNKAPGVYETPEGNKL